MAKRKKQTRPTFVVEPGYVWCDKVGTIHDDSLDPYDMGSSEDKCSPEHHFPVYVKRRGCAADAKAALTSAEQTGKEVIDGMAEHVQELKAQLASAEQARGNAVEQARLWKSYYEMQRNEARAERDTLRDGRDLAE